ncbi:MAG TPA: tRNA-binding protein [Chitinophagales bacterium]|nr:tRNA-binding protein [Chitinophagales bacterium]
MSDHITFDDFLRVDIRTGTIIHAQVFEKARKPAYQLEIDFGALGIRKSSAQITAHYTPEQLIGKQIVAVVNFPVKQIANFFSECLVLGAVESNGDIVLLQPTQSVENGLRIA